MSSEHTKSKASGTTPLESRLKTYDTVSAALKSMGDKELSEVITKATLLGSGWGTTVALDINGTRVFAKQIPLTDIERRPENVGSTANLFNLPMYYQYGVGSAGFGAWRELEAQKMASDWVRGGECHNFPLMYESRVLPVPKREPMNAEQLKRLDEMVEYWGSSEAVRKRLKATYDATATITVFMENIPDTLHKWLGNQFTAGGEAISSALTMVESGFDSTTSFMKKKGLLHFDAHPHNILTDGNQLYFADFGLAISSKFNLSREEREFFDKHQNYDKCETTACLCGMIGEISKTMPGAVEEKASAPQAKVPKVAEILEWYSPVGDRMNAFYRELRADKSKTLPYPATELDHHCSEIDLRK